MGRVWIENPLAIRRTGIPLVKGYGEGITHLPSLIRLQFFLGEGEGETFAPVSNFSVRRRQRRGARCRARGWPTLVAEHLPEARVPSSLLAYTDSTASSTAASWPMAAATRAYTASTMMPRHWSSQEARHMLPCKQVMEGGQRG